MGKIVPHIQSKYISSATDYNKCPAPERCEVAFIGRSNVGKSSLINMLTNNNHLARVSSTPGKTETINHYLINEEWYLVDLPGYGYSKKGKVKKLLFSKIIEKYIKMRENLTCVFVLIDIRHAPQEADLTFFTWLITHEIPIAIVFTKADKLSAKAQNDMVTSYKNKLLETWEYLPETFVTSAQTQHGREELIKYIIELCHPAQGQPQKRDGME
ncbi:MAG: ribosome biogenesis GTP-binding protein YihA/YsxC [Cytophagales bacterium]|nr:ribosome biogenesis GTP-binding protein YihA/YsxC [Cytophagales bacterium]